MHVCASRHSSCSPSDCPPACASGAAHRARRLALEVKGGRGVVQITGKGVLVGRIGKGSLEIVDLSPNDQWSPRVNGIPRGKTVTLRGKNVSFYMPGGRYKIIARGSDISISARGTGAVVARRRSRRGRRHRHVRESATTTLVPLPVEATKATFGPSEASAPSSSISQDSTMTAPQTILDRRGRDVDRVVRRPLSEERRLRREGGRHRRRRAQRDRRRAARR